MGNVAILGISLGTRQCGIAIIKNGTLIDWKVKSYSGRLSENKLIRICTSIERIVKRKHVIIVACKVPTHMKTVQIDYLVNRIKRICTNLELSFCVTTVEELKSTELPKLNNKEEFAELITKIFPELATVLARHKKLKTEYYMKVFEAVGAAHYCLENRGKETKY